MTFDFDMELSTANTIDMDMGVAVIADGGTDDYTELTNKPSVNGVELAGNKTSVELKLYGENNEPPYPQYNIVKSETAQDGYFATYYLAKDGVNTSTSINIPKDYLVKSADVKTSTGASDPSGLPSGTKYIDFVVNTYVGSGAESHIYLNVNELVDAYTAGDGIEISDDNVISADVSRFMVKANPVGTGSFSMNRAGTTIGTNSCAINQFCEATGIASFACGTQTKAQGNAAHSEGMYTIASGQASHAEGLSSKASGSSSHAEGRSTTANKLSSHAEGGNTTSDGNYSHAEGYYTTATSESQHVQGEYNVLDTLSAAARSTYSHIVGNGTSSKRSNAHTLDWQGNAWYAGDVYVGSTSGTNKDDGSKKLIAADDDVITNLQTQIEALTARVEALENNGG